MQQNSGRTEKQAVVKVQTLGQVVKITLILLILHMQIYVRKYNISPSPWCRSLDAEYQVVMYVVEHGSVGVTRSAGYAP